MRCWKEEASALYCFISIWERNNLLTRHYDSFPDIWDSNKEEIANFSKRTDLTRQSRANLPTKYLFIEKMMKMTKKGKKWFYQIYEISDVRRIVYLVILHSPKSDDALIFS